MGQISCGVTCGLLVGGSIKILIEVDISQPLNELIVIETPSGPWDQPVEYEWRPKYCNECLKFGHNDEECWYKKGRNTEKDDQRLEERREDPIKKKGNKGELWQVKTNPGKDIGDGNAVGIQNPALELPRMGTGTTETLVQRSGKQIVDSDS
ncbi:hypothetical protein KY290_004942 [Solanum tuberosum]|uniref:Zinc knuckle CX2CX4HX4C domain-containing protein n=1 Tax=Solanum tuberosum TaxID=4113 RepID=A0ABQ7WER7_SOLTU|nr:hypothetical protein KY290_004942 [Solanum tuberosum]